MRYPETLLRLLIAAAALCLSYPLSSIAEEAPEPSPVTSPRRVPDSPPLRPTVDVFARYDRLADPYHSGFVDLAQPAGGLELTIRPLGDLLIRVSPQVSAKLTDSQRSALLGILLQYSRSPDFQAALTRVAAASAAIEIHYGNFYYDFREATLTASYFGGDDAGHLGYRSGASDTAVLSSSVVYISINEQRLLDPLNGTYAAPTPEQLAATVVHELLHLIVPGRGQSVAEHAGSDEIEVRTRTATAYPSVSQQLSSDTSGLLVQAGTGSGPLNGGPGSDNLYGSSIADVVYGLEGNDVVVTRGGNDTLHGGPGDNLLDGGPGNDRYELQGSYDIVMDGESVPQTLAADAAPQLVSPQDDTMDRVVARHVQVATSQFIRSSNTLFIISGSSIIQVDRQWLRDSRIEYFEFAEGVYTAADVAQLAGTDMTPYCFTPGRLSITTFCE